MHTTFRLSQARANRGRAEELRSRLMRSAYLGGEVLAFASLASALTTGLVAMAAIVGL
ncbi:hypothetical protein IC757_10870 [Wenzhouxiangella sp. AB-CW3]|uniref:hypothetical protein n=1 Tax=Wenzhouxiangella sp. AB-CW3 TaxID=2771012 RepID=UPI00168B4BB4|nr:hypothetical protein [Wenzhouxiangella sp. AB-CW3]QOC21544.1 hypothetical protein IC757_10870 [Wenzhouxiangella sp. AB-CW3]